jgi:hypothetical protein
MQYFQAQARYVLPALGPIACAISIGAWQLLGRMQKFALPAIALLFLSVNVFSLNRLPEEFAKRIEAAAHIE